VKSKLAGCSVAFTLIALFIFAQGCTMLPQRPSAGEPTPLEPVATTPAPMPPDGADALKAPPPTPQVSKPASRPPARPQYVPYKVQSGDILSRIAYRYGVTPAEIVEINGLKSANAIRAGMTLMLPAHARLRAGAASSASRPAASAAPRGGGSDRGNYTIKPGDSLSKIAAAHGVSVSALKAANHLTGDNLVAGKKLTIPGQKATEVKPAVTPAIADAPAVTPAPELSAPTPTTGAAGGVPPVVIPDLPPPAQPAPVEAFDLTPPSTGPIDTSAVTPLPSGEVMELEGAPEP